MGVAVRSLREGDVVLWIPISARESVWKKIFLRFDSLLKMGPCFPFAVHKVWCNGALAVSHCENGIKGDLQHCSRSDKLWRKKAWVFVLFLIQVALFGKLVLKRCLLLLLLGCNLIVLSLKLVEKTPLIYCFMKVRSL